MHKGKEICREQKAKPQDVEPYRRDQKEPERAEADDYEREEDTPESRGYIDLEGLLSSADCYTDAGRCKYIPALSIPVREFDPRIVDPDSSFVIYGSRRTGKSIWMRWFAYHWRDWFDQVYVFTRTKRSGFWQKMVPGDAVYQGYDDDRLGAIIELQEEAAEPDSQAAREGITTRTAVWFDDVVSDRLLRVMGEEGNIARLYVEGRHLGERIGTEFVSGMQVGLATQMITAMPPKIRKNLDFAVIMKQTSDTDKERLWTEYAGRLNKRSFFELIEQYTKIENPHTPSEQRHALVIVTDPTLTYNERFFVSTPIIIEENFQLGSRQFREAMESDPDAPTETKPSETFF